MNFIAPAAALAKVGVAVGVLFMPDAWGEVFVLACTAVAMGLRIAGIAVPLLKMLRKECRCGGGGKPKKSSDEGEDPDGDGGEGGEDGGDLDFG